MNGTTEVIFGAVLSIIITIWIEYLRKPKLRFRETNTNDIDYSHLVEKRPAKKARFLNLTIENSPLALLVRWLSRTAALQCHAAISFYHLDGQDVFARVMTGRWSGTVEPTPTIQILGDGNHVESIVISGNATVASTSTTRMDIYPGERASLDIAVRFDDDSECFGWNDEGYFSEPLWRNPKWRLLPGRYIVKVELTSAGDKATSYYRLINDTDMSSFRLEQARADDIKKIVD